MELKDLSSNWKKLQATLKSDTGTSKPPKRKTSTDDILRPHRNDVKRLKVINQLSQKFISPKHREVQGTSKMGSNTSRQTEATPAPSASLALWAEDNGIPAKDLATAYGGSMNSASIPSLHDTQQASEKVNEGLSPVAEAGKYIAVDCEMVGVGPDPDNESTLARVSIVNYHGHQVYDSFVLPKEQVTDYRTFVSGITPRLLKSARTLEAVQADVAKLLDGRILVGHSVRNDLDALLLGHPKRDIRDTSRYPGFRQYSAGRTPGLKKLAKEVLGIDVQGGEHSSIEDARATMLLYRREKGT